MSVSSSSYSHLEKRIRDLEARLGCEGDPDKPDSFKNEPDLAQRLQLLEQRWQSTLIKSKTSGGNGATSAPLSSMWAESTKLLNEELDPGTALTHQQQIAAPILYRRQEVLASAKSFKDNMEQVSEILSLLLIDSQDSGNTKAKMTESQVTQAPIVVPPSATMLSDDHKQRLDELVNSLLEIQQRADTATSRLDTVLDSYHSLATAISEKTITVDEAIRSKQRQRQQG